MGSPANTTPVTSDGAKVEGPSMNRSFNNRFEWISSSPTPATIAALKREFPEVIQVPLQALEEETTVWSNRAVIARSLSRWVPPEAIVRELRRGGVSGTIEPICLAHRHYLLRFSDPSAKLLVLGNPWTVNGQVMAMEDWRPQFVPTDGTLSSALIWIRLPSLPLEFWSEAVLRSILTAAGSFVFLDSATREKKRGGYARACVKVDLGKPLRPGVRVRGSGSPFWQAFVYENIDSFCSSCGLLHHAEGGCSAPEDSPAAASPLYGPWMAAVRRQRPPPEQSFSHSSKFIPPSQPVQGKSSISTAATGGWQVPKKTSRRRAGSPIAVAVAAPGCCPIETLSGPVGSSGKKEGTTVTAACQSLFTVPVSCEAEGRPDSAPKTLASNISINPFALLGSDKWAGRPKSRKEANPGPLKRARPGDYSTPKGGPKVSKGKGKLIDSGNHGLNSKFTFSASKVVPEGKDSRDGQGSLVIKSPQGPTLDDSLKVAQPIPPELHSHECAVELVKKAIHSEVAGVAMDSQDQGTSDGGPLPCGTTDTVMIGEEVGPPLSK